uniref:Uncharacterized protein n=1 Tax=Oryza sativa subsp. japonica TaxID=39947 RepID=Q5Z9V7_ORYSJ|nr:hypothetical protein [Oryza sativa Japonica Group]
MGAGGAGYLTATDLRRGGGTSTACATLAISRSGVAMGERGKPLSRSCTGNLELTGEEKETVRKLMDEHSGKRIATATASAEATYFDRSTTLRVLCSHGQLAQARSGSSSPPRSRPTRMPTSRCSGSANGTARSTVGCRVCACGCRAPELGSLPQEHHAEHARQVRGHMVRVEGVHRMPERDVSKSQKEIAVESKQTI